MALIIYQARQASPAEFVAFWESFYRYPKDELYTTNIAQPLTPERIHSLFEWKNGSGLSAAKRKSVEKHYIARIAEVSALSQDTGAAMFLEKFPKGGAIWRIFWLHCWQPTRFPIYDQHVHRAMVCIEQGILKEIPTDHAAKVKQYLERYIPFLQRFQGINPRSVDKALWFFGKFIKGTRLPLG
jgi:hypothetical protein